MYVDVILGNFYIMSLYRNNIIYIFVVLYLIDLF